MIEVETLQVVCKLRCNTASLLWLLLERRFLRSEFLNSILHNTWKCKELATGPTVENGVGHPPCSYRPLSVIHELIIYQREWRASQRICHSNLRHV